jgi:hypothetical protein
VKRRAPQTHLLDALLLDARPRALNHVIFGTAKALLDVHRLHTIAQNPAPFDRAGHKQKLAPTQHVPPGPFRPGQRAHTVQRRILLATTNPVPTEATAAAALASAADGPHSLSWWWL